MNCLTYLLDLWRKGERFKILYNGDHAIGYNETDFFDYGNHSYENSTTFSPIEKWHNDETLVKIFKLDKVNQKTIEEYYASLFQQSY